MIHVMYFSLLAVRRCSLYFSSDTPDLSGQVSKLEGELQMMRIDHTELVEKCQLANKTSTELQEKLGTSLHEQNTLKQRIESVSVILLYFAALLGNYLFRS